MTGCIVNNYNPLTSVNFLAKQDSSMLAEIAGGRHGDLVSATEDLCNRRDVPEN